MHTPPTHSVSLDLCLYINLSLTLLFSSSIQRFRSLANRLIRLKVSVSSPSFISLSNGASVWKLGDLLTSINQGLSLRSSKMSNPSISKQALPLTWFGKEER